MQISPQSKATFATFDKLQNPAQKDLLETTVLPSFAIDSRAGAETAQQPDELKEAFQDFVGQTFFGEMIKAFRSTQQPSKYFHGGRAEEIFQGQFDQVLTEKLSEASSDKIADPMYELFMMKRSA